MYYYVLLCIIMYYYVLVCVIMYYYVLKWIYGHFAGTPFIQPRLATVKYLAPIFRREYFHILRRLLTSIILLVRGPPPFFTIGRAPKILDGNTRRNIRRKIIDVVLGTARDKG